MFCFVTLMVGSLVTFLYCSVNCCTLINFKLHFMSYFNGLSSATCTMCHIYYVDVVDDHHSEMALMAMVTVH